MSIFDKYGVGMGVGRGLAYKHNWAQDMSNLMQAKQYQDQKKQEREQNALWVSEREKTPFTSTPYGQSLLDASSNELLAEMKKFRDENPDFKQDAGKMTEYGRMADKLINNPLVAMLEDVKMNYAMLQADDESSIEHKSEYLKLYDEWANKEYDPKSGIAPLDALTKDGTWRYKKEDMFTFVDVLDIYDKKLEYDLDEPYVKGDFQYKKSSVSEAQIDQATNEIYGNAKYFKSAEKAYAQLQKESAENGTPIMYNDINTFIKQSLRRQKTPAQILAGKTATAQAREAKIIADAEMKTVPLKLHTLLNTVVANGGRAKDGAKLLRLTAAGDTGGYINLMQEGGRAYGGVNSGKPFEDMTNDAGDLLGQARAIGAEEIFFDNITHQWMVSADVVINHPEESQTDLLDELKTMGFIPTETRYSDFAAETNSKAAYYSIGSTKKQMRGKVIVRAYPENPSYQWNYESYWGKSDKRMNALTNRSDEFTTGFNEQAEILSTNPKGKTARQQAGTLAPVSYEESKNYNNNNNYNGVKIGEGTGDFDNL